MAYVVVTLKIMPESPDVDLEKIQKKAEKEVKNFGGNVGKVEIEEVAFGLKAINIFFTMDEKQSNTDPLEENVSALDGVNSAQITDIRRAIG